MLQMMAVTNRPELRPLLLLLLTMSSLVSCEDLDTANGPQPMTTSSSTQEHGRETTSRTGPETQSTKGQEVLNTTQKAEVTEAKLGSGLAKTGQRGSNGNHSSGGTERNTTHQAAGTESTEISPLSPERNGTFVPTLLPEGSAPTHLVSVEHSTNKPVTNSVDAQTTTLNRYTTLRTVSQPTITSSPAKAQSLQTQHKTTTTTTKEVKKGHVCPTEAPKRESVVGRCLFAIALLAGLVTIFIVTTIILATKLATVKHRHKSSLLQETEMVCISALMNDTEHPVPKPRHPKSNGALIPSHEDEDGDDLTLNSFLPDTECAA